MMSLSPFHRPTVTLLTCITLGICISLVSSCWSRRSSRRSTRPGPPPPPHARISDDWDEHRSICGRSAGTSTKLVDGGVVSSTLTWPWMALLEIDGGGPDCTAEIVARRFVTTAAHCVNGYEVNQLSLKFKITDQSEPGVSRRVRRKWVHPDYVPDGFDGIPHDIALLELDEPLTYGRHVRPVCLPDSVTHYDNCWAVGWGVSEGESMSNKLRELKMRLLTQTDCSTTVNAKWGTTLADTNICAVGYNQNTATGNDGGSLVCKSNTNQWILQGINGFGNNPDIFVRVSKFSLWIRKYINDFGGPGPFELRQR